MICTLFPACVISEQGIIYYVTQKEHALKELNMDSQKVKYIDNPKGYEPAEWTGVDRLLLDNNKLFLFEQNGSRLLEYSLTERTCRYFDLNCNIWSCDNWSKCVIARNKVFAFSSFANKVVKVDLSNGDIKIEKIHHSISYLFYQEKERYIYDNSEIEIPCKLFSCGCQVNKEVWIFTERKGIVLKYDLFREESIVYSLPKSINGCMHVIWIKGLFYILSIDGKVFSWDLQKNKAKLLFNGKIKFPYAYFGKIAVTNKNIWILPCFGKDIYVMNLKSNVEELYSTYPKDFCYDIDPSKSKFYGYTEDSKNYYFAMHSANYILIINKESGKEIWVKPKEPTLDEKIDHYIKASVDNFQELDFGIDGLFLIAKMNKDFWDEAKRKRIGEDIWNFSNRL